MRRDMAAVPGTDSPTVACGLVGDPGRADDSRMPITLVTGATRASASGRYVAYSNPARHRRTTREVHDFDGDTMDMFPGSPERP
jgi:hypothetical protein